MKYELAIAVVNEADHTSGLTRKKEGEIVCVKPHPSHWGRKAIDEYFIVIVETAATLKEMRKLSAKRLYRYKSNGLPVTEEDYMELTNPEPPAAPKNIYSDFEMMAKNRYAISFLKIQTILTLDLDKIRNKTYIYQPFKKASQLIEGFDGIDGRHLLTGKDVDCKTDVVNKEQEFIINLDTLPAIIFDKYINKTIKPVVA